MEDIAGMVRGWCGCCYSEMSDVCEASGVFRWLTSEWSRVSPATSLKLRSIQSRSHRVMESSEKLIFSNVEKQTTLESTFDHASSLTHKPRVDLLRRNNPIVDAAHYARWFMATIFGDYFSHESI